jgi:hypothetical protein
MTKARRRVAGAAVVVTSLLWASCAVATASNALIADQPSLMTPDARVRGETARMVALITYATAQSTTFRGLVDRISTTDGIVYITEGHCRYGARACLPLTMTMMGRYRLLRILVDRRAADRDLMAYIGHELQHAIEVLSFRSVRSSSAMILLYQKICGVCGLWFETNAAVRVGNAVRDELLKSAAPAR